MAFASVEKLFDLGSEAEDFVESREVGSEETGRRFRELEEVELSESWEAGRRIERADWLVGEVGGWFKVGVVDI